MITTVNKKISMDKELLSRIKWACTFSNCVPKYRRMQIYGQIRKNIEVILRRLCEQKVP